VCVCGGVCGGGGGLCVGLCVRVYRYWLH